MTRVKVSIYKQNDIQSYWRLICLRFRDGSIVPLVLLVYLIVMLLFDF